MDTAQRLAIVKATLRRHQWQTIREIAAGAQLSYWLTSTTLAELASVGDAEVHRHPSTGRKGGPAAWYRAKI